ncbi:hypothetical protein QJ857_gp0343 [Tupanvirus soda lake]|uniref:Uncharacterized protein n=2 Tax=Tupanvirus TaxID=2094720 RepID=A0A6N1NTF9_9VIRU|nr:hypothetical protein QJ857_gp0343 [Tupanvirus soda lake]QKU35687.1 hypothetical protein [Tupanvirus soda lake]
MNSNTILIAVLVITVIGSSVYANPIQCTDNTWSKCVNITKPPTPRECRRCFDSMNQCSEHTVQKRIVQEYFDISVERRYQDARLIFAEDITSRVPSFSISFTGLEKNIGYLYLNDPDISDQLEILNITILENTQDCDTISSLSRVFYRNVQNSVVFDLIQNVKFEFNELNQISLVEIYPDTLKLVTYAGSTTNTNITSVCEHIQNQCVGSNQQYSDLNDCVTYMESIPFGDVFRLGQGYSFTCRAFHEVLSRSFPDIHCPHVGKLNIDPVHTPCNEY